MVNTCSQVASWRAVEALRAGVPNRDAVQALGSSQPVVEERFAQMLNAIQEGLALDTGAPGILFAGDFGSGKSHLLEYLRHVALENRFICSKVVISKETPLYDPAKMYQGAIQSAKAPDWTGAALRAVAARLDFHSPEFERFQRWLTGPQANLDARFAASVFIFQAGEGGLYPEISDHILRFWGGATVPEREMRAWLQELGEEERYRFEKVPDQELIWQRFRFMSRLMEAAGYSGWIILVDEVELIGRYSLAQRAKSYGEMARLLGSGDGSAIPGLAAVFAITSAYQSEVMDEQKDRENVAAELRNSGDSEDTELTARAELAMQKIRQIPREGLILSDAIDLREIYDKCRTIYAQACGWNPPPDLELNGAWSIRQHIKRWINSWDLASLFLDRQPDIQVTKLEQRYSEDLDLEQPCTDEGEEWGGEENDRARPRFVVLGGKETFKERIFAPDRQIAPLSGDPVSEIEWRWCVPGFEMPWQFASGYNLKHELLVWEFDKAYKGASSEKWDRLEENQLGIEIRFPWRGRWRRELHRFPLRRQEMVDSDSWWIIGREILPPITYDE